jgi:nifR3 family TIM-barrel protein
MYNIWKDLKKPIMVLAPMDDVTDSAFRRLVTEVAAPDLFFTEFANVDGLFSVGNKTVMRKLYFTATERPLIAQIWGNRPENYEKAAKMLVQMGYDGIDINMGCPERSVMKKGSCAALINNPNLAKELIDAAKQGAQGKVPVSVKTRIGTNTIVTEDWAGFLLQQDIAALTIHGRTAKEMSAVPAHWDEIGKVVRLRNTMGKDTVIIGNGDVRSMVEAQEKVAQFSVDGVMIGRGIFENVWVFDSEKGHEAVPVAERMKLLLRHMELFEETWQGQKNFQILKKFFKIYVKGFENASEVRMQLMEAKTPEEVRERLKTYL